MASAAEPQNVSIGEAGAPQTGVVYWGHELHRNHQSRGILPHTELLLGFLFSNVRSLKHPACPCTAEKSSVSLFKNV